MSLWSSVPSTQFPDSNSLVTNSAIRVKIPTVSSRKAPQTPPSTPPRPPRSTNSSPSPFVGLHHAAAVDRYEEHRSTDLYRNWAGDTMLLLRINAISDRGDSSKTTETPAEGDYLVLSATEAEQCASISVRDGNSEDQCPGCDRSVDDPCDSASSRTDDEAEWDDAREEQSEYAPDDEVSMTRPIDMVVRLPLDKMVDAGGREVPQAHADWHDPAAGKWHYVLNKDLPLENCRNKRSPRDALRCGELRRNDCHRCDRYPRSDRQSLVASRRRRVDSPSSKFKMGEVGVRDGEEGFEVGRLWCLGIPGVDALEKSTAPEGFGLGEIEIHGELIFCGRAYREDIRKEAEEKRIGYVPRSKHEIKDDWPEWVEAKKVYTEMEMRKYWAKKSTARVSAAPKKLWVDLTAEVYGGMLDKLVQRREDENDDVTTKAVG